MEAVSKFVREPTSIKWKGSLEDEEKFCMDLADMDFGLLKTFRREIMEEMGKKNNFTYKEQDDRYENSVILWYRNRYEAVVERQFILPSPSINQLYSCLVLAFTEPSDKILVMSPVFYFYQSAGTILKRQVIGTELMIKNNRYEINWQDFNDKIKQVKLMIVCNPHNPTGRIWNKPELDKIVEQCKKNNVYIFSDQILCDLATDQQKFHTLIHSDYEKIIVGNSISKSFNSSSIQGGYALIKGKQTRQKLKIYSLNVMKLIHNEFSLMLLPILYGNYGKIWLQIVDKKVKENFSLLKEFISKKMPRLNLMELESGYLLVVDFVNYVKDGEHLAEILRSSKIVFTSLEKYYCPKRKTTAVRIAIACEKNYFQRFLLKLETVFVGNTKL